MPASAWTLGGSGTGSSEMSQQQAMLNYLAQLKRYQDMMDSRQNWDSMLKYGGGGMVYLPSGSTTNFVPMNPIPFYRKELGHGIGVPMYTNSPTDVASMLRGRRETGE